MDYIYIYIYLRKLPCRFSSLYNTWKEKKKSLFHLPVCALEKIEKNIHTGRIDPALPFEGETIVLSGLFRLLGYRRM